MTNCGVGVANQNLSFRLTLSEVEGEWRNPFYFKNENGLFGSVCNQGMIAPTLSTINSQL
jgi:hypothetical protein